MAGAVVAYVAEGLLEQHEVDAAIRAHASIVASRQRPGVGGVAAAAAVGRGDVVEHGVAGERVDADVVRRREHAHGVRVELDAVARRATSRSVTASSGPTQSRHASIADGGPTT